MATSHTGSSEHRHDQPSLVVKLKVDAQKLAQILSREPRPLSHGQTNDYSDFAPRYDILRDLSPIRGSIKTPATSLANAPVLSQNTKSRATLTQPTETAFAPIVHSVPTKREDATPEANIHNNSQAPHPKRQRVLDRCEGCHTREAVNIGYWIVETPKYDQLRNVSFLDKVCIHKLRGAKVMADAMLENAQQDLAKATAELTGLRARAASQGAGRLQLESTPTPVGQALQAARTPSMRPPTDANGRLAAWLTSQDIQQGQHDMQAQMAYTAASNFFLQRVPAFPENELRTMLQHMFNAGRTYESNTRVAAAFRDGISQGKKAGIVEGWNNFEQHHNAGGSTDLSETDSRGKITAICVLRDVVVREKERLRKMVDELKVVIRD